MGRALSTGELEVAPHFKLVYHQKWPHIIRIRLLKYSASIRFPSSSTKNLDFGVFIDFLKSFFLFVAIFGQMKSGRMYIGETVVQHVNIWLIRHYNNND